MVFATSFKTKKTEMRCLNGLTNKKQIKNKKQKKIKIGYLISFFYSYKYITLKYSYKFISTLYPIFGLYP